MSSARISSSNSSVAIIPIRTSFFGEKDDVGQFTKCGVSVMCDLDLEITVYQSANGSSADRIDNFIALATAPPATQHTTFQSFQKSIELTHRFVWITARNNSADFATSYCRIETQVYNSGVLKPEIDGVGLWGKTENGTSTALLTDTSGVLLVAPSTTPIALTGENSNFVFQPTATNNTVAVYADGVQGTNVAGGWQYANTSTGKINWYCYASPDETTAYKVSQLNSVYAVINQQSTLGLSQAQNPWIMVYTQMDSGTNSGAFFKSKLFWGSNAHTDISGIKLLYTGEDPIGIHPEITGINRIQLQFNSALSNNKQLANVQNETILTATLQTTNNSPANQFFFTMEEFGVDWVKTPTLLPVEFGKVKCDIAGQAVVVSGALTVSANRSTQTQTVAVSASGFASTSFDLSGNSVVDALLLASGAIINGGVRLDYSSDGSTWFPDNANSATITSTDPHAVFKGIKTASRYVRVSSGSGSTFRGTLQIVWCSTAL